MKITKSRIDQYVKAIQSVSGTEYKLTSKFKTDISSLASSIRTIGLVPSISLFTTAGAPTEEAKVRRNQLMKIIKTILFEDEEGTLLQLIITKSCANPELVNDPREKIPLHLLDEQKLDLIKSDILEVLVGIKLSIRTFELIKKTQHERSKS